MLSKSLTYAKTVGKDHLNKALCRFQYFIAGISEAYSIKFNNI